MVRGGGMSGVLVLCTSIVCNCGTTFERPRGGKVWCSVCGWSIDSMGIVRTGNPGTMAQLTTDSRMADEREPLAVCPRDGTPLHLDMDFHPGRGVRGALQCPCGFGFFIQGDGTFRAQEGP